MKVLYICADTGIDVLGHKGASIHVREMIAAFHRAGHSVELVAPRLTKPGAEPAPVHATVHRVRVPDEVQDVKSQLDDALAAHTPDASLSKDVRRLLYGRVLDAELLERYAADPPDVIYARGSLLSIAGVALARACGRPLVVELNAPLADEQQRYRSGTLDALYSGYERDLLLGATLVITVSDALAEHAARIGVDPRAILVLPNGIDPARFCPAAVDQEPKPVLGFVGGLRAWHGVEVLPEVLHRVRRRVPNARLVIAGDGPGRAAIELAAERWDVREAVTLLGTVDHTDMPDIIRGFGVALAPYPRIEHDFYFSPLKMFEYMGCGVPVVASEVGQIGELVGDGEHARLVPPGDIDALVDACCSLLLDPGGAAAMGRRGAAMVHARYTWDANAAAVIDHIGRQRGDIERLVGVGC